MHVKFLQRGTTNELTGAVDEALALLVAQAKAQYEDIVGEGNVFGGMTAAAGVAPGTSVGTTAPIALVNPANSAKKLIVLKASVAYISGTLGAGALVYAVNILKTAAAVTGTAIAVVNLKLGTSPADRGNSGLLFTTATLPATPTLVRPFACLDASLATTAGIGFNRTVDNVDGEIQLLENTALSIQGIAAAGTAPLVVFGLVWAEKPLK